MKFLCIIILTFLTSSFNLSKSQLRSIASLNQGPKLASVIDSSDALKARRHVFENKNSNRFYLSTYDFEEDTVGLANIKMAIEQARNGARVDVVLDAAGHSLSDEMLLYMLESGVKVHIFSPQLNWNVFWARYKSEKINTNIPGYAIIRALWTQISHRTHEKILINYDESLSSGGEILIGGRNLKDSHFELNNEIAVSDVSNERYLNPMREHEHEGLVYDIETHKKVSQHINSLIDSDLVQPLSIEVLREKLEKSRNAINILNEKQLLHKRFSSFQDELLNWILRYEYNIKQNTTNYETLTDEFIKIFEIHQNDLIDFVKNDLLSIKKLNILFKQIYGQSTSEIIQNLVYQKVTDKNSIANSIYKLVKLNKINIRHNLIFNSKNILGKSFHRIKKYLNSNGTILDKLKKFFISKRFNLEKYYSIEMNLQKSYQNYLESEKNEHVDWITRAKEVDQIIFMSDTIEKNRVVKHSMDKLFEAIKSCEDECIWNSQYGSLTPRAIEAIKNVINLNSSYYRYAEKYLFDDLKSSELKSKEILSLFESNLKLLNSSLINPNLPASELKKDIDDIQRFMQGLFTKSKEEELKVSIILRDIRNQVNTEDNLNKLFFLMKNNKQNLTNKISKSPKKVGIYLKSLQGLIDHDPKGILPLHKNKTFYFMSNDIKSWTVYADKIIQADFHHTIYTKLRRLGPGLNVIGYNNNGRIHSKVFAMLKGFVLGSNNADPRSENINTETGIYVVTKKKGQELSKEYMEDIKSYMHDQTFYIKDGKLERPKHCFDILTRILRSNTAPIL